MKDKPHAKRDGDLIEIYMGDGQWMQCTEYAAREYMRDICDALAQEANQGNSLADLRKQQELSQAELADITGVSRPYLSEIERGVAQDVSLRIARKIATALDCSLDEIRFNPQVNE